MIRTPHEALLSVRCPRGEGISTSCILIEQRSFEMVWLNVNSKQNEVTGVSQVMVWSLDRLAWLKP